MGCGGGHDVCRTSTKGIEYRVRGDGSLLINQPRIWDTPYTVRVLVEVSADFLREFSSHRVGVAEGDLVDELWIMNTEY